MLFLGPVGSLNLRVQVVEPALAARLTTASVESVGKVAPHHMLVAIGLVVNVAQDDFILVRGPVPHGVGGRFF